MNNQFSAESIAALSKGRSAKPILDAAVGIVAARAGQVEHPVDVGCGAGDLFRELGVRAKSYVGVDLVKYQKFPSAETVQFVQADSNGRLPLGAPMLWPP